MRSQNDKHQYKMIRCLKENYTYRVFSETRLHLHRQPTGDTPA
jgi:hypothetical protein